MTIASRSTGRAAQHRVFAAGVTQRRHHRYVAPTHGQAVRGRRAVPAARRVTLEEVDGLGDESVLGCPHQRRPARPERRRIARLDDEARDVRPQSLEDRPSTRRRHVTGDADVVAVGDGDVDPLAHLRRRGDPRVARRWDETDPAVVEELDEQLHRRGRWARIGGRRQGSIEARSKSMGSMSSRSYISSSKARQPRSSMKSASALDTGSNQSTLTPTPSVAWNPANSGVK